MSKQKTPLAELIEELEYRQRLSDSLNLSYAIIAAKKLLPKEREAIINAAEEGYHEESSSKIDGERYFNENFQQ